MARKKKQEDEGGGASWMDTYGDLVTLLLCFFVLLFASSSISEDKWRQIVESFTGSPPGTQINNIDIVQPIQGFNESDNITEMTGSDEENMAEQVDQLEEQVSQLEQLLAANGIDYSEATEKSEEQQAIEEEFNKLYQELTEYISAQELHETVLLSKDGLYIYLTIVEGILFDSGRANIRDDDARQILTDISQMIKRYENEIQRIIVEGHTDNVQIHTAQFADNFDLSSIRANEVIRFMSEQGGMPMSSFISTGMGEFSPISENETTEGKQKNRRVNVTLIAKNVDAMREASIGEELSDASDANRTAEQAFQAADEGEGVVEQVDGAIQADGPVDAAIQMDEEAG